MKACRICGARYAGDLALCPLDRGPLDDAVDPLAGRRLRGVIRLGAKIGEGAIAAVYRARHDAVGREVAVKILSRSAAASPALRERFLREARAVNRIRHPNVVEVFDAGEESDGLTYLVMELCEGETLAAALARGPMPIERAVAIAVQLADALDRAHALGVVHRDLKPGNVILGAGDPAPVKLVDFGLAKVKGELGLTATGALCGTPAYLAPELIEGASAGAPGDLYALGVVLFEMLTGAPPFSGSAARVLDHHAATPPPAPSSRRAEVPAWLDEVVLSLLDKVPARRPEASAAAARLARGGDRSPDARTLDAIEALGLRIAALTAARERGSSEIGERYREVIEAARAVWPGIGARG